MTPLLYLMACLMSPSPLIDLAESRVLMLLGYALGIESEIDLDVPIKVFSHDIAVGLADYWSITPRSLMNALQDGIIEPMVLVSYPSLRIIYTDLTTIRESTG